MSYSRKNSDQLFEISDGLKSRGFAPNFDQSQDDPRHIAHGISAEDEWWSRIQEMIVDANAVVLLVSSAFSASKVCSEEVVFARTIGKRVIPVLVENVDLSKLSPHLAALNIKINASVDQDVEVALDQLCLALNTDVKWYREGRRYDQRANEWRMSKRSIGLLLQSDELRAAQEWERKRPASADPQSDLLTEFIQTSVELALRQQRYEETRRAALQEYVAPILERRATEWTCHVFVPTRYFI